MCPKQITCIGNYFFSGAGEPNGVVVEEEPKLNPPDLAPPNRDVEPVEP
jgi:hypothetical protein